MFKKLYAVLMSLFLTAAILPQPVLAEEESVETTEETVTEAEETTEEVPEEEIAEEVSPAKEQEEEVPIEENGPEAYDEIIEDTAEETTDTEPSSGSIEDAEQIFVDTEIQVTGDNGGIFLKFIPEITGQYKIYSYNNEYGNPAAYLKDENENYLAMNDDGWDGSNFSLEVTLDKGKTYYILAGENADSAFSYSVKAELLYVFNIYSDFEYIITDSKITITRYIGNNTEVEIPFEIDGLPVTSIEEYAFSDCSSLTSITIPGGVTSIGESAFSGCINLTSITIPDSVTSIEYGAFFGCSKLTSITIPDGVTSIGSWAFCDCSSLTSITIPGSVASIKDWAFVNCSSLTSVTILEGVTSIGESAFDYCSSLTSITIPDGVTSIGESAFSGCTNLTSITIPDGITNISDNTFYNCSSLTSITIPNSVESIGDYAFGECSSLKIVTILYGVTSIGLGTFNGCSSLTSVVIPDSVTSIGDWAFSGCSRLTSIMIPSSVISIGNQAIGYSYDSLIDGITITGYVGSAAEEYANDNNISFIALTPLTDFEYSSNSSGITISKYKGNGSNVVIPSEIEGIPVTVIAEKAFFNMPSINTITIPESVTYIGEYALGFYETEDNDYATVDDFTIKGHKDTAAEEYVNNNGFTFINLDAKPYDNAEQIFVDTEIHVYGDDGESVYLKFIPDETKEYSIYSYNIDDGDPYAILLDEDGEEISTSDDADGSNFKFQRAFEADTTYYIQVKGFNNSAFDYSVIIETESQGLQYGGFKYEINGSEITITKYIGLSNEVVIPAEIDGLPVTGIEGSTFSEFSSLTKIIIPENVTDFGYSVFEDCNNLKTAGPIGNGADIEFGWTSNIPNGVFSHCSSLTSVTIPEGITSIGDSAFSSCWCLTDIVIPAGVTRIGDYTFYLCDNLSSITIPNSVTYIGTSVFYGCNDLTIYGYEDTYAEQYADDNVIEFIKINKIEQIYVDTEKKVNDDNGNAIYLTFVPEITGQYRIYSYDYEDCNPYAEFYDEYGFVSNSDDEGDDYNFKFIQSLEAGKTYTIRAFTNNHSAYSYSVNIYFVGALVQYDNFECLNNGTEIIIKKYLGSDAEVAIPSEFDGVPVTDIGEYTFYFNDGLTSVIIPDSVINIGESAFDHCINLTNVTIPNSVNNIEQYAFFYCSSLTNITIPDSVINIGDFAFNSCSGLISITIPDNVMNIGYSAFGDCSCLTNIIILSSAASIGGSAFRNCSSLTSINIPEGITSIENSTFDGCRNLAVVNIPSSITSIGNLAFYECDSMTNITIPSSVTHIGTNAIGYYFNNDRKRREVIENFVITGETGSAAETYANENGIQFISLNKETITDSDVVSIASQTYTGNELTPEVTVTVNGKTLIKGTDYSVTYENNTNAGTASATVTGIGIYDGTVTKEFTINPKSIIPEVTLTTDSYTYNGKTKTPGVTVKDGDTTLTKGTDYSVKYADGRTNAGTYDVTVTMKGNYKGTKTVSFTINKAAQSVTAKAAASAVSVGKTTTISVTGAQGKVTYSSADTTIATVSTAGKVTAKKVGTVKINVVSAATANYKKKTVTVTIKVVPAATTSITAENLATGIKVTWKKVTGATGYYVYRNDTKIATIQKGATVTYTDSKANTNGTKYTYKIVAYASTGTSKLSKSLVTYRVARPAISSLTNSAAGKMTVKWGKNAKATGYQVQYSTTSTFDSYKTVTITSNATVSKVIASLTKGKTYYVRVRSYKTVSSKKYYSMWSVVKKLKLTK